MHAERTSTSSKLSKSKTGDRRAGGGAPTSSFWQQMADLSPQSQAAGSLQRMVDQSPIQQAVDDEDMLQGKCIAQLMSDEMEKHTFKGDRNRRLSGFHSKADTSGAELTGTGSTTAVGTKGAYEQNVVDAKHSPGDDGYKTKKGGKSSFFPDAMSKQDVVAAVDNASGDTVVAPGKSWNEMKIHKGSGAFPKA